MHATGVIDPDHRRGRRPSKPHLDPRVRRRDGRGSAASATTWSRSPPRCCDPVGLGPFAAAYPDRCFDVGIAEQHALTSAAGLAMGGLHPVVALYATFLNRAFDQLLMDVALHKQGVTLVLDRAGVTGEDGAQPPRHVGHVDPRHRPGHAGGGPARRADAARGAARGRRRSTTRRRCCATRRPRSARTCPRWSASGAVDVLPSRPGGRDVLLVAVGAFGGLGVDGRAAAGGPGHRRDGRRPALGLPGAAGARGRWPPTHELVVTVEDGGRHGGFGSALAAALRDADVDVPLRDLALPQQFLEHGDRGEVLAVVGLTAQDVARACGVRVAECCPARSTRRGDVGFVAGRVGGHRPASDLCRAACEGVIERLRGDGTLRRADSGRRGRGAAGRRRSRAACAAKAWRSTSPTTATTGHEKATITRYDVVVLDRDLPGMSGDELCRRS